MPFQFPRQLFATPSGSRTISADPVGSALSVDTVHTGTVAGLSAPTLTVSSTGAPTVETVTPSPSLSPVSSSSSGTLSTGVIIGIIVGIFVVLAVTLIIFMTVRHRKRRVTSRARALSSARKSWTRLHDDSKPAEMQMRATNLGKTASVRDSNATDQNTFLSLNSTSALVMEEAQIASPLRIPTQQRPGHTHELTPQPSIRSTEGSRIPNPFTSPATSPSHSPTASHTSTYSSHAPSVSAATVASFAQRTPLYDHMSAITASSASEFQYPLPSPRPSPPKAVEVEKQVVPPPPARLVRKYSAKAAEEARSRELRAMQDLISALDVRASNKKDTPSAFNLKVDTSTQQEKSRLSMGEGLVTPGDHSMQEEDAALKYYLGEDRYNHPGNPDDDRENFPLPPPEIFRAALSPSGGQRKVDKGKGKAIIPNPFQDPGLSL